MAGGRPEGDNLFLKQIAAGANAGQDKNQDQPGGQAAAAALAAAPGRPDWRGESAGGRGARERSRGR